MISYETVSEAVNDLTGRGYTEDFSIDFDCIYCTNGQRRLNPDEFEIDEFYRFEGATDPSDETIVYAISAKNRDLKGTLVNAYGVYSDATSDDMVKKLEIKR